MKNTIVSPVARQIRTALAIVGLAVVADVKAETTPERKEREEGFSEEILRQRGIDPALAEYFRDSAGFTPGSHRVSLIVNGASRGRVSAQFTEKGTLCFTPALLKAAGLVDPLKRAEDATGECNAFTEAWPLSQIDLRPGTNEVELLVPPDALLSSGRDVSGFTQGGRAAIFNYEVQALTNQYQTGSSQSYSGTSEAGINAGNWVARSRQLYNSSGGQTQFQHLDAYVQRSFASQGALFQAGQIQQMNPVLGGAQINGVQWMSEHALAQQSSQARVEGIAQSQARVEVREAGNLIYSTVVPSGPFVLSDIPRQNPRSALDVTVIEADGSQHNFTVSAALAGLAATNSGYAYSFGQVRNVAHAQNKPWVASAGMSGIVATDVSLTGGMLLATDYVAVGTSVGKQPWKGANVQWDVAGSHARQEGVSGALSRLTFTQSLGSSWSADASASWQSDDYRDLLDTSYSPTEDDKRVRNLQQYDARIGWNSGTFGSLSAGVSQTAYSDDTSTRRAIASWSMGFRYASLSFSAERDLGSDRKGGGKNDSNAMYISLNVPLGDSPRVNLTARNSPQGGHRLGVNVNDSVNDAFSYRVGAEQDTRDNGTTFSAGASMIPRYAQLDLGYYGDGSKQNSLTAALRGGVVVHGEGVTLSPYHVQDTFGVVDLNKVSGVKLSTPSGPVWTNGKGHAVIPQLSAYGRNTVEITSKSLPKNVDVVNGVAELRAGRGTVEKVNFNVNVTRRVLLTLKNATGGLVPEGAMVSDQSGQPLGMVEKNGELFLADASETRQLWVTAPGQPRCLVTLALPEQTDTENYYETANAVCKVP